MKITDKRRMDWIANNPHGLHFYGENIQRWANPYVTYGRFKTIRKAVDAAIRAEEKKR